MYKRYHLYLPVVSGDRPRGNDQLFENKRDADRRWTRHEFPRAGESSSSVVLRFEFEEDHENRSIKSPAVSFDRRAARGRTRAPAS